MQSGFRVNHKKHQVGLVDRLENLPANLEIHRDVRIIGKAAGVDEPELSAAPFRATEMSVASGASFIADDCRLVSHYPIEQRRLSYIRPTDESDYGNVHAATASSSLVRTSMKSYDG